MTDGPAPHPTNRLTPHPPEEALAVETYVDEHRGQWVVSIAVAFADGVVRREISTYRTKRKAEIAASWIKRAAERDHSTRRVPGALPHAIGPQDAPDDL